MFHSDKSLTQQTNPMKMYTVAFDIDYCIALGFDVDTIEEVLLKFPIAAIFQKNNLYIDAIKHHVIHPGIKELIQLLDRKPNIRMAFFSSGADERNIVFVPKLMSLALGEQRYNQITSNIRIGSRSNLLKCTNRGEVIDLTGNIKEKMEDHRKYQNYYGQNKKDLSCITDDLENIAIIDDDSSYSLPSQVRNLLKVPSIEQSAFVRIYASLTRGTDCFTWKTDELSIDEQLAKANNLYFATGLLFTALENAEQKQLSLAEALAELQFIKDTEMESKYEFIPRYFQLARSKFYFQKGLELLRQINPTLEFIDDRNFLGEIPERLKPTSATVSEQGLFANNTTATTSATVAPQTITIR